MKLDAISIATIAWVRTPAEDVLLRRCLTLLSDLGVPVAVAERGGNAMFSRFVEALPNFHVTAPAGNGLVAQVCASVQLAATFNRPYILYTEPDKEFFFRSPLHDFFDRAADDAGVVLAARVADCLKTFPPMQRYTEGVINHLMGEVIGCEGDYSYGPFLFHRAVVPHVLSVDPTLGWGWRHCVFYRAHEAGIRIAHVRGVFPCPADQQAETEADRIYRITQLSENLKGLLIASAPATGRTP